MNRRAPNKVTKMTKKNQKIKLKKAPTAPKRFKSAYMFYSENQHREIRLQAADTKVSHPGSECYPVPSVYQNLNTDLNIAVPFS